MRTVSLVHHYTFEPDRLWQLVVDLDALAEVMKGLATFAGLPEGRIHEGQRIDVRVSLFGLFPSRPYSMHVVRCDDEAMSFRSQERGSGIRVWQHDLRVVGTDDGCRLEERVVIDAGPLTWIAFLWARYLYTARHKARLRLLRNGRS